MEKTCYRAATSLEIDRANKKEASPVNAETIGLNDALNVLAPPLSTGLELRMDCLRAEPCLSNSDAKKADPPLWFVEWHGIPTDDNNRFNVGEGRLSFRSIWQMLTRQYTLGLQTLNSKSHLSFLPNDVVPVDGAAEEDNPPWTLRYAVTRQEDNEWQAEIDSIHTIPKDSTSGTEVEVGLTLGLALNVRGEPLTAQAILKSTEGTPALGSASQRAANLINIEVNPLGKDSGEEDQDKRKILIGGVLLGLKSLAEEGQIRIMPRSKGVLGQPPIMVYCKLGFNAGRPAPAGEDPELGYETVSEWQDRDRPLVYDLTDSQDDYLTKVEIREQANRDRSRTISIGVRTAKDDNGKESPIKADVVVLDPSPLRIARVIAEGEVDSKKDKLIATFEDDPENPMGWEFATETGELELILPPQAIGEEMIKGMIYKPKKKKAAGEEEPPPVKDQERRLFDFRLSPSTWLHLDRTGVTTARAPAPWSLRRILGRRVGEVGLELLRGEFELLYGMTTRLEEVEGLRIADQEALIGRIPFPDDLLEAWRWNRDNEEKDKDDEKTVAGEYAKEVAKWISGLLHHPSELPIFRDWANREELVIDQGVEFDLRPTRQTCDPFKPQDYHPLDEDEFQAAEEDTDEGAGEDTGEDRNIDSGYFLDNILVDKEREPLRGGVDYGFESPNIYKSMRKNAKVDRPGRPQGSLAGVRFGTLGGTGGQEALFDEGRTIIISKTTQGRLDTLTIIRVGRITMLWNHARHVIVYERTTRTAPRYGNDQSQDFEGLAALRKVKEYVEITQPRRSYPDVSGTEKHAGPLVGSFFESTVIPVRSQWGKDITEGFVMPLRGPVEPGYEKYYPKPNIHLEFARAPGKGGKVSQLVKNPDKLAFFSSTREGEGSNPDAWIARADVDFPVTETPKPPEVNYLPSFSGARKQPDALNHDYGQGRFTLETIPGEEAANLVHGRPLDGIEARIRNVSLARGKPRVGAPADSLEATLGSKFGQMEAQIADTLRELSEHAARLSAKYGKDWPIIEIPGLRETGLKLVEEVKEKGEELGTALKKADNLPKPNEVWEKLQESWHADSKRAWEKHLDDLFEKERQLKGVCLGIAKLYDDGPPSQELKKLAEDRLRTALTDTRILIQEKVQGFPFVPQRALESLAAVTGRLEGGEYKFGSQAKAIQDKVLKIIVRWEALITDIQTRLKTDSPENLKKELELAIKQSKAETNGHFNDAARVIKEELGSLFPDPIFTDKKREGPVQHILNKLDKIADQLKTAIEEVEKKIPSFKGGAPDFGPLLEAIQGLRKSLTDSIVEQFGQIAADLWKPLNQFMAEIWLPLLEDQKTNLKNFFDTCTNTLLVSIEKENFPGVWEDSLKKLRTDAEGKATELIKLIDPGLDNNKLREVLTAFMENDTYKWFKEIAVYEDSVKKIFDKWKVGGFQLLIDGINGHETKISELSAAAAEAAKQGVGVLRNIGERIEEEVAVKLRDTTQGAADGTLEMVRCLAEGPVTDTLESTRDWVGYYYDTAKEELDLTRSAALFNDLGQGVLNSLSTQLPFDRLRDRLLPRLDDFNLNQLLPDFAGLKLEHLFSGVKIPKDLTGDHGWVNIRHGFDKDRLAAWTEVKIDREFTDSMDIFRIGPLGLRVLRPRLLAESRFEKAKGQPLAQRTRAELRADWVVDLKGEPVLTIQDAALKFDESGHLDFDFKAKNLLLAPALQFVTDAIKNFMSPMEGLTITPVLPGGIRAELSLPLPDLACGAFLITGVTLYTHFDLAVAGGFEVSTGFWLSRPNRPFGLAVLFLGGGGWFGADVKYRPPKDFEARVSVGISAGAMAALNFGVAQGSAGILFTVGLDFYMKKIGNDNSSSSDVAVSISMLVWGEFNILGIASAYLNLVLRIEYRNGTMTGHGWFSLKIKICWCFTLEVCHEVHKTFSGGGQAQKAVEPANEKKVQDAVDADFENLDW